MKLRVGSKKKKSFVASAGDAADGLNKNAADGRGPPSPPTGLIKSPENGSKEEVFFEAKPWLDSDSEDDFHSIGGDFTPSRASTPNHQSQAWLSERKSQPFQAEKKQRLLELLQEKQQEDNDDDDDRNGVDNVSNKIENDNVHVEQHLNSSQKQSLTSSGQTEKEERPTKAGCFPSSIWKLCFKSSRKKKQSSMDQ